MNIQTVIERLIASQDLPSEDMRSTMRLIMKGHATPSQIAGFLVALRCKGESIDEIAAAAEVMRDLAEKISVQGPHLVDTCGTGGDGANTFNISTTASFVVAAAGARVAKHGNRSVSSRSGSADVLEAGGVNLELSPEQVKQCIEQIGIGFLFAPRYHSAMKHALTPRRELGIRTLFNLLGPLSNPAGAKNQLIGVFDKSWVVPMANALLKLGSHHVLVVHADDGLDEISIAAPTFLAELKNEKINTYTIAPDDFGIERSGLSGLAVDDVESSLSLMKSVLNNEPGPALDIVLLNAGAAIYAANVTDSLAAGIEKANAVIESGAAGDKLDQLIELSHSFDPSATYSATIKKEVTLTNSTNPPDVLKKIIDTKIEEIKKRKRRMSIADLQEQIQELSSPRGFYRALKNNIERGDPAVIAEIKKASPSKGVLREDFNPLEIARSYEKNGAACLSVLTDKEYFQGSEVYLHMIHDACAIPILRKDFMIDPYQIYESRAIGSDCVLLIVAALGDEPMKELADTAIELDMDVLVEVHNQTELQRALNLDLPLIGVNNRNLHNFETTLDTTIELLRHIPEGKLVVTESGIHTLDDVALIRRNKIDAFLVGEAFMTADDPGKELKALFFK